MGQVAGQASLTVLVAGEHLSLPMADVAEIVRPRRMTRVPHGPVSLLGLANLRGTVLPVVSLAALLGLPVSPPGPAARIVVTDKGALAGLLVDAVSSQRQGHGQGRPIDLPALLGADFTSLARGATAGPRRAPAPQAVAAEQDRLVLIGFTVAGQDFALPLDAVLEVGRLPAEWAEIPGGNPVMLGVMAFRDGLLPLASLRRLLALPDAPIDRRRAPVIIVRIGGTMVGLVADGMRSVLRLPADEIDAVPPVLTRGLGETKIAAIGRLPAGRLVCILSPATLFDAETAAPLLASRPAQTAQPAPDAMGEPFMVFHLGTERYGVPVAAVREVVRRPARLASVPRAPAFLEGAMNLRGRVIPVLNQRRRLGIDAADGQGRRVLVVAVDGLEAGLAVDAVFAPIRIPATQRQPAPLAVAGDAPLIDRVATTEADGGMTLLLDPSVLLSQAERDVLAALTPAATPS
jgi:purine-binding chemotaxis protein CheW